MRPPPEPAIDEPEADRRIAASRHDFDALVAKADHRLRANDRRAANSWYGAALRAARSGAKASSADFARAERSVAELGRYFRQHTLDALAAAGHGPASWHPRFAKALAILHGERARDPVSERFPQLPNSFFYPDLPYLQFADTAAWDWAAAIAEQTAVVQGEARTLLSEGRSFAPYVRRTSERPQGDVHGLIDNDAWQTLDLTELGRPVPDRVALAPRTYAIVGSHAPLCDIPNRAPSVMFSLLAAGQRIPPHTGMINTRLICHLPLIVPGEGALRVGAQTRQWIEGEIVAFDDTVEHEAWNRAARDRLVLIFDIWRPELEPIERAQIRALFAAVDAA